MWYGGGCNTGSAVTGIWVRVCRVSTPPPPLPLFLPLPNSLPPSHSYVIEYEDILSVWKEQIMCSKWMQIQMQLGCARLCF